MKWIPDTEVKVKFDILYLEIQKHKQVWKLRKSLQTVTTNLNPRQNECVSSHIYTCYILERKGL